MLYFRSDGTYSILPRPTSPELVRHAERFGVECVAQVAAEFMGVEPLAALIAQLDSIERVEDSKRRYSRTPKRRKSAEERARKLLGIEDEQDEQEEEC